MLCGVIDPTSGGADVLGYDVQSQAELVKQRIGYMSQKFSLFEELTVDQNLKFYAGIYGLADEKFAERRAYVLRMADLEGREDELTKNLSVGWKQRLALGCATIHEPELLFLDEPTSGVDPIARRQFWELLYELSAAGVTLFVTTHYMDEAAHCNRLAFMFKGRLIAEGSPQQVRDLMRDTVVADGRGRPRRRPRGARGRRRGQGGVPPRPHGPREHREPGPGGHRRPGAARGEGRPRRSDRPRGTQPRGRLRPPRRRAADRRLTTRPPGRSTRSPTERRRAAPRRAALLFARVARAGARSRGGDV